MLTAIRRVIDQEAKITVPATDLGLDDDLYALGLTPYLAVRVMLALEQQFSVEFSRRDLTRETTRSIGSIKRALEITLSAAGPAAA